MVSQWKRAWHSKIGVCACVCVCPSMTECSMVASAHHCEWNRVGSVLSTMRQQWQQPSGRPIGRALPLSNSSGLKALVLLLRHSELPQRPQEGKETQARLTAFSALTCWYDSRTHTYRVRASDHIKLLIWSLAPELVE